MPPTLSNIWITLTAIPCHLNSVFNVFDFSWTFKLKHTLNFLDKLQFLTEFSEINDTHLFNYPNSMLSQSFISDMLLFVDFKSFKVQPYIPCKNPLTGHRFNPSTSLSDLIRLQSFPPINPENSIMLSTCTCSPWALPHRNCYWMWAPFNYWHQ